VTRCIPAEKVRSVATLAVRCRKSLRLESFIVPSQEALRPRAIALAAEKKFENARRPVAPTLP
jgi:hypothetical protein